jgi:hypothetical protein
MKSIITDLKPHTVQGFKLQHNQDKNVGKNATLTKT